MPPCLTVAIASKLQSPLAGAFREGLDLAVVAVAAAVEDAFLDACLLAPLADLPGDVLALVADALALVGLGRALLAHAGGHLTYDLLRDPAHHHLRGSRHLEVDALGRLDLDGM